MGLRHRIARISIDAKSLVIVSATGRSELTVSEKDWCYLHIDPIQVLYTRSSSANYASRL